MFSRIKKWFRKFKKLQNADFVRQYSCQTCATQIDYQKLKEICFFGQINTHELVKNKLCIACYRGYLLDKRLTYMIKLLERLVPGFDFKTNLGPNWVLPTRTETYNENYKKEGEQVKDIKNP